MSVNSDVVIVGGGIVGLASAYELGKRGVKVKVVERGICGREASWAGAGVLQCGNWHRRDPLVHLLRESLQNYAGYTRELYERTHIDPQFENCGSFELLLEDQQYRMAASEVRVAEALREQFGRAPLELLSPEQARAAEPRIAGELLGVKYCPITSQVRNPDLVRAIREACLQVGVEIIENCPVQGVVRDGSRVTGVRTSRGDFSAGHVVLSAGSWSALVDAELGKLMPVYPVRGQIVLLEMHPRPFTHIVERGKCYMIPRFDGRIVIGATEEHGAGYDKSNTAEGVGRLLMLSQQLVPALAGAKLVRTWAGLRPGTPDRGPFIGPVKGHDNLIAACGHFRSGLILAPITAQIVADLITTGGTKYDLSRYAAGREFKKDKKGRKVPIDHTPEAPEMPTGLLPT